jgi:hypothetical protein
MLQAYPTKSGTGVSIFGDYADLKALYVTVHHFAETLTEKDKVQDAQSKILMNFAYEIRKAYSGDRLTEKLQFNGESETYSYYGFQVVWTDMLIYISTLRRSAGYSQSDKMHQASMYLLEYVIEKALYDYDPEGADVIKGYIGQRIQINSEYVFLIYQAVHIKYVSETPGKNRFRQIPIFVGASFTEWSTEYKEVISSLQKSADEQKCEITDLEFSTFPEIKW